MTFPDAKCEDKQELMDVSLCPKTNGQYNIDCIQRKCSECGVGLIDQKMSELKKKEDAVIWNRWEMTKLKVGEIKMSRNVFVSKSGSVSKLIEELLKEAQPFAEHLFIAEWQHHQYLSLQKTVPAKWAVTTQDFAENYRCLYADEIQSAYYNYKQATLYTQYSVYGCPKCDEKIKESSVFITADLKHDSHAVKAFQDTYEKHLKDEKIALDHQVIFSDGAAAQFKSKMPYMYLTNGGDFSKERSFFGSRHGKSVCDGLGGVVKQAATIHVASRKGIIRDAQEFHAFAQKELTIVPSCPTSHTKRIFFFEENINRPEKLPSLKPVPNTRENHSVRAVAPGVVEVRRLSCFCNMCLKGETCSNAAYTGTFSTCVLEKQPKRTR